MAFSSAIAISPAAIQAFADAPCDQCAGINTLIRDHQSRDGDAPIGMMKRCIDCKFTKKVNLASSDICDSCGSVDAVHSIRLTHTENPISVRECRNCHAEKLLPSDPFSTIGF